MAQTSTGTAETTGPCSPATTGNNNQLTINCQGIGKEQGDQLLRILNRIAKDQIDPKLVLEKLDEIQKGITEIRSDAADRKTKEDLAERQRRTAPAIHVVGLVLHENGMFQTVVECTNDIPFEFRSVIVTENGQGIMGPPNGVSVILGFTKFFPSSQGRVLRFEDHVNLDRVANGYIELRFTYRSLSYEELHLPGHFALITRKFRLLSGGSLVPLDGGLEQVQYLQ